MHGARGSPAPTISVKLIRFVIVGVLGTMVYYLSLWCLVELIAVPVLTASSIAFAIVTAQNYVLHHGWTFGGNAQHRIAFPKFIAMNIAGFWINWAIMATGVHGLALNYLLVQAFAIAAVVTWNFALSSLWIFRQQDSIR